mgnify:CR=1 FL=1
MNPYLLWITAIVGILSIIGTSFYTGWNFRGIGANIETLAEGQKSMLRMIEALTGRLLDHERIEGHPGISQRLDDLKDRIERIEKRIYNREN